MFTYRGKWALVTGAGRGIGAAVAEILATRGINVYIHCNQSCERAKQVAIRCANHGVDTIVIQSDLASGDGAEQLLTSIPRSPDYVINNAALSHYGLVSDLNREEWQNVMNVNAAAPLFISQGVLSHMITQQFGRIVNVSSIWGASGASYEVLYSMSKGALNAFTRSLAKELALSGVTVNGIAPGAVDTDMIRDQLTAQELQDLANQIPMGRLAKADEIANVIAFLLSDQASYITGQIIGVNGGWS